ncbi:MAG TPA: DUF4252 domain-containing protein [Salegentibacter sp.]|uniref:DUF4252 domain-containing protein n=1 Tax=Salegentibacter sp. TaxID=1903072 RepID=UPI002F928A96
MKKITILIIICLLPLINTAQAFKKYESRKDVDEMIMTSKMFKMLAKVDFSEEDEEAQQYIRLIENLDEIRMFTSSNNQVRSEMVRDVDGYLKEGNLELLMKVNEDGKKIKFYSKPGKNENVVSELFMFLEGHEDGEPISVILSITGDIDLSQLSRLTRDLKVPGAEELDKLDKKS